MQEYNQLPDGLAKVADKPKTKTAEKLNLYLFIANIALAICVVIAIIVIWKYLQDTIPMHWTSHGKIDRYGNKNEFFTFFIVLVLFLIDTLMYFVIKFKTSDFGIVEICITHGLITVLQLAFIVVIAVAYAPYLIK